MSLLHRCKLVGFCTVLTIAAVGRGGPYTEPGVNGFVDENFRAADPISDPNARINPIFRGWASAVLAYEPADSTWSGSWDDPNRALGPITGDNFDVVSLGELDEGEIAAGDEPGQITLVFGDPSVPGDPEHIRDVNGYDFVVFENGFISQYDTAGGSVRGQMLAELGYVEVSSNGVDFVRFDSVCLAAGPVGPYGTIEISDVYNLAGKHPNAYGVCTGTPFDLHQLADHRLVRNGTVDINDICFVRIVDVPGSGDFFDGAGRMIDPATWPNWTNYDANHPVYDAWVTEGSGGFDLEAIGVLKEQNYSADVNLDGIVDLVDFALLARAWQSHFGQGRWISRCDIDGSGDLVVDGRDLAVFAGQWLKAESWRSR